MSTSCTVIKNGQFTLSQLTGLKPLIRWLNEQPDLIRDSYVIDRIVGKASALLLVYGGARKVHGLTMSRKADEILTAHGIEHSWDVLTDYIVNRTKTGMCPMEQRVVNIDDPEEAYHLFKEVFAEKAGQ